MERLENLMLKLKEHEHTHPNLTNLWRNCIEEKIKNMEGIISQGEKVVDNIKNSNDLQLESIPFMLCMCRSAK